MTRVFALFSLIALAVSACGPAPQGVGFVGIGSEPVGVTVARPGPDARLTMSQFVPPRTTLPLHRVNSTSLSQPALAAQALAAGGRTSATAKPAELVGRKVMVSLTEVGGELFLVGRVPKSGLSQSLVPGTDRALLGAVPHLTGCHHQGKVYRAGVSQTHPEALAIPLSCG
ncbi:MAG: hypothetical protein COB16_04615 [Rhodobacteraceae bacterium]|nr:MAG: hypothetical protein COB16_04615 [Paracoccaceae bacterium]